MGWLFATLREEAAQKAVARMPTGDSAIKLVMSQSNQALKKLVVFF